MFRPMAGIRADGTMWKWIREDTEKESPPSKRHVRKYNSPSQVSCCCVVRTHEGQ